MPQPRKTKDAPAPEPIVEDAAVAEADVVAEGWEPVGAAAKLAYIQTHIRNVAKTGRNTHHNYDYFQEHGLLDLIRPMMRQLHCAVVPSPTGQSYTRDGNRAIVSGWIDFIDTDQPPLVLDQHGVPLVLPTGPVENPAYRVRAFFTNEGVDNQDKATNKALTGWMKYALQKLFAVPTEKVDDADHADVKAAEAATSGPAKADPQEAEAFTNGPLKKAVEDGVVTKAQVVAWLGTKRASAPAQLTAEQLEQMSAWLDAKRAEAEGKP